MSEPYAIRKGEFGWALEMMQQGHAVRRVAWAPGRTIVLDEAEGMFRNDIGVFQGVTVPSMLAKDWELAE